MDLQQLRQLHIQNEIGIDKSFGKIACFIDFGNVNYWFSEDDRDEQGGLLLQNMRNFVDLGKLYDFLKTFSSEIRFYYGHDPNSQGSQDFIRFARNIFGKNKVFTKPMQKIRHHLSEIEASVNTRDVQRDHAGDYILLPKCNFDVEISVDAVRLASHYDTFCLLSGDSDFLHLLRFLRMSHKKKSLLIKGGYIQSALAKEVELNGRIINAQDIKRHIAGTKQKPGVEPGLADRKPESTGRTID